MGSFMSCIAMNLCECAAFAACSCISMTLSQAARFGHMLVILATFALAIILGQSSPDDINGYNYYTKVDLVGGCDSDFQDSCIYRQLIYRASFSLILLFAILSVLSYAFDYVNRSFWVVKFGMAIGLFIAFWWVDNSFFNGWAEVARVISFFWLLIQGLLLIDFSHDAHDLLMNNPAIEDNEYNKSPYVIYLTVSFGSFFAAILGLVYLYIDYAGCDMGMFFTIVTLVLGVLTTVISLLDSVNKGLLTPCLMFAYSVFMCWYALLSNPHESCNPTANSVNGNQNGAIIVISVVSIVILMYCVINGTKILNLFDLDGEGVMMSYTDQSKYKQDLHRTLAGENTEAGNATTVSQPSPTGEASALNSTLLSKSYFSTDVDTSSYDRDEIVKNSGTPQERGFFHLLMILVCCYGTMILTNWGNTDGSPAGTSGDHTRANESMWLKIVSQWVFLILYCRVLQVSYEDNQRANA